MNWLDLPIKEKIRINNEQGFTVDNIFPKGTGIRERWDEMIEKTWAAAKKHFTEQAAKNLMYKENIMNKSPNEILKEK